MKTEKTQEQRAYEAADIWMTKELEDICSRAMEYLMMRGCSEEAAKSFVKERLSSIAEY